MAIGSSGYYGLTLEKQLTDALGQDMESTSVYAMLVTDAYTPAYDTHDFRSPDITNEVTAGSGYTAGGKALDATPAWTVATPAAGQINYDSADVAWATSTITDAMAAILYHTTGVATTDPLYLLSDFGSAVSTANGTLTVQVDTNGWVYFDYVPV
jgi:hypothetical protein